MLGVMSESYHQFLSVLATSCFLFLCPVLFSKALSGRCPVCSIADSVFIYLLSLIELKCHHGHLDP